MDAATKRKIALASAYKAVQANLRIQAFLITQLRELKATPEVPSLQINACADDLAQALDDSLTALLRLDP